MEKGKVILGLRNPVEFDWFERKQIVEEYLQSNKTKREIWRKYTGQPHEGGSLLIWIRKLGYQDKSKSRNLVLSSNLDMAKDDKIVASEFELKERIKQLEKALLNSELRATAYETMIEIAEKELKISIRKKSNTKQSTK
jgi:transposase